MKKIAIYILLILHVFSGNTVFALAPFSGDLILHYDAQDMNADGNALTGEPSNGVNISSWQDAANASTGSQIISSSRPIYFTGAIHNSLPGITFDGTNDILETRDEIQINLDETFSEKSFALVIETGTDINSLQTLYEQWTHEKWYGFQISGGKLYGWVWNTLDWASGNEYKIIDFGNINPNETYFIMLVHDSANVSWYLNGVLINTLSGADTQWIHGICRFESFFDCSIYNTGSTIGIGATQNDTLNLSNSSQIEIYQGNYFSGSIGEIISWNRALSPWDIAVVDTYLQDRWNPDTLAPTIDSYSPQSDSLLPTGIFTLYFSYSDNLGGSGINSSSGNLSLQKWNSAWWVYGSDISGTYVNSQNITTSAATFDISGLPYGKYKASFSLADNAGNTVNQEIILYIDAPELIVSSGSLDLWNTDSFSEYYSQELEITVKTLGAAHEIFLKKNTDLISWSDTIEQYNGTWYWYDLWPSYSNSISDFWVSSSIGSSNANINTNGDKNIYTYRIKIWALIDIQQAAGDYEWSIDIGIELEY